MSCMSPCRLLLRDAAPGHGPCHGRPGRDPPGGRDHQHGRSAGDLRAGHPLAQAAAQHGALGQLARKRKRCQKGSRRDRRLQAARRKVSARKRRQIRDLRHKGTRAVIAFCHAAGRGLALHRQPAMACATADSGRHHNQRMANGNMARTSPISPTKPNAPASRASLVLSGEHRASVRYAGGNRKSGGASGAAAIQGAPLWGIGTWSGSVNMHPLAFGTKIDFPAHITYQRPGPVRVLAGMNSRGRCRCQPARCSRPDTGHQRSSLVLSW